MTDEYDSDNILAADLSTSHLSIDPDTDHDIRGAVPNGEIREVIQDLRDGAAETPETLSGSIEYRIRHELANELSKVLKEHTHE